MKVWSNSATNIGIMVFLVACVLFAYKWDHRVSREPPRVIATSTWETSIDEDAPGIFLRLKEKSNDTLFLQIGCQDSLPSTQFVGVTLKTDSIWVMFSDTLTKAYPVFSNGNSVQVARTHRSNFNFQIAQQQPILVRFENPGKDYTFSTWKVERYGLVFMESECAYDYWSEIKVQYYEEPPGKVTL